MKRVEKQRLPKNRLNKNFEGRAASISRPLCGFLERKESVKSKLRILSSSRRQQLVSFGLLPTISQHRLVPRCVSFIERTSPPGHSLLSGRLALF
jgi:hypothetical protein